MSRRKHGHRVQPTSTFHTRINLPYIISYKKGVRPKRMDPLFTLIHCKGGRDWTTAKGVNIRNGVKVNINLCLLTNNLRWTLAVSRISVLYKWRLAVTSNRRLVFISFCLTRARNIQDYMPSQNFTCEHQQTPNLGMDGLYFLLLLIFHLCQ